MSIGDNVKRLRELVSLECQTVIAQCKTRDECMDVSVDLGQIARMVERYAEEDCYDRAMELDKAQATR